MTRQNSVVIDFSAVNTRDAVHETLALALGFPEWYGKNWDAFRDCLGDPDLSRLPEEVTIRGADHLSGVLPREYRLFVESLADFKREYPERAFKVRWA